MKLWHPQFQRFSSLLWQWILCNLFRMSNMEIEEVLQDKEDPKPSKIPKTCPSQGERDSDKEGAEFTGRQTLRKKKCALLLSFCGKDYKGMQTNPGVKTIEEELIRAVYLSGAISEEMRDNLGKLKFQRCARTDKGVSAARQLVSLKMVPEASLVVTINEHLPKDIKVMKLFRAIKSFNSKDWCDSRTYEYFMPTYAFAPSLSETTRNFRLHEGQIERISQLLRKYHGTHNFHNFTSGRTAGDPSSKRYIISFECDQPKIVNGNEYISLKVQGQSFVLHQIRKMIGLLIAVVRGHVSEEIFERCFLKEKVNIPRAPGLYLILENVHFDRYNRKFGSDGTHQVLEWTGEDIRRKIEDFKVENIFSVILETELKASPMLEWLATLNIHTYDDPESLPHLSSGCGVPLPHPSSKSDVPLPHPSSKSDVPLPHPLSKSDVPLPHPSSKSDVPLPHLLSKSDVPLPHPSSKSDVPLPHPLSKSDVPLPHPSD